MSTGRILWSESAELSTLDDRWQQFLEDELGVSFHGVNALGASTVAHRFVADETTSDAVVLRVVRHGDSYLFQLVAYGSAVIAPQRAAALRDDVRSALDTVAELSRSDPGRAVDDDSPFASVESKKSVRDTRWDDLQAAIGGAGAEQEGQSAEAQGLLLDLSAALHHLASLFVPAGMAGRERARLHSELRAALEPVRAAAKLTQRADAAEAREFGLLLGEIIEATVGRVTPRGGGPPVLAEALEAQIAGNAIALMDERSFEADAAEFLDELALARAGWSEPPPTPDAPQSPAVSQQAMTSVLGKLEARVRRTDRHVAGFIDIDRETRLAIHYSRGREGVPDLIADRLRRAMHLDETQFERLVVCAMTREEFVAIVRRAQ